jgi:hypothetical protein
LKAAGAQPRPLSVLLDISPHSTDSRLVAEFMALAHRIDGLKHEVVQFNKVARAIETEVLPEALDRGRKSGTWVQSRSRS